jgi:hypothetical protein
LDSINAARIPYPGQVDVYLIGCTGDKTWNPIAETIARGKVKIREIESDAQFQFRDANLKRLFGGKIAIEDGAEMIFFTDTKVILPKDILLKGTILMREHQADSVAGTFVRWPGQDDWWARVQDEGLVTDTPRFGKGKILDPAKTLNMPITAVLFMKAEAFGKIKDDWPTEVSIFPSHEDSLICLKMLKAGFRIYVSDSVCVYHKHRTKTSAVTLRWRRAATAMASMVKRMPDNPFVIARAKKAGYVFGAALFWYYILFTFSLLAGLTGVIVWLGFFVISMFLLGIVNAFKSRDVRAILYPWGTLLLLANWMLAFIIGTLGKDQAYSKKLLQIH